jgi:hypothetical protein
VDKLLTPHISFIPVARQIAELQVTHKSVLSELRFSLNTVNIVSFPRQQSTESRVKLWDQPEFRPILVQYAMNDFCFTTSFFRSNRLLHFKFSTFLAEAPSSPDIERLRISDFKFILRY